MVVLVLLVIYLFAQETCLQDFVVNLQPTVPINNKIFKTRFENAFLLFVSTLIFFYTESAADLEEVKIKRKYSRVENIRNILRSYSLSPF